MLRNAGTRVIWVPLGIALVVSACQPDETPLSTEPLRVARELVSRGELSEARKPLAKRLETAPTDGETAYLLGVCEHGLGRPERAVQIWGKVLPTSPFFSKATLARGQTLAGDLGRFSEAEDAFRTILDRTDDEAVVARHAVFQLYFYEGRQSEMRGLIESAWNRLPDRVAELRDHWRIDHVTPDLDAILEAVEPAYKKAPEDDRVWLAKAYLDTLEGRFDEARRWLDQCLKARPEDAVVWKADLRWARKAGERGEVERRAGASEPG